MRLNIYFVFQMITLLPVFPINRIGITYSVLCSDGYMYEEMWLVYRLHDNVILTITREMIEYVNECCLTHD